MEVLVRGKARPWRALCREELGLIWDASADQRVGCASSYLTNALAPVTRIGSSALMMLAAATPTLMPYFPL